MYIGKMYIGNNVYMKNRKENNFIDGSVDRRDVPMDGWTMDNGQTERQIDKPSERADRPMNR